MLQIICPDGNKFAVMQFTEMMKSNLQLLMLQYHNRLVWKEPYFGDYNIVMSHIRNIREKIEDNPSKPIYIQTVWGVGYKFNNKLK